jgi:hypothetical protein
MAFIQGEARNQGTLFPATLEEYIPADHVCRVIDFGAHESQRFHLQPTDKCIGYGTAFRVCVATRGCTGIDRVSGR